MALRLITSLPSRNHGSREPGTTIDMLVLHYTGMPTARAALERLCNPASEVSAHYLVHEDGRVMRLVPEDRRAWHAGISAWRGSTDINNRSIGIEIVNPGHEFGYVPFPDEQMAAVIELSQEILGRHPAISARNVVGHSDVAPWRKEDPGELFDWPRLAAAGIGRFPSEAALAAAGPVKGPGEALQAIGYRIQGTEATLEKAIVAFQRRYHPTHLTGAADDETRCRITAVGQMYGVL